MSADENTPCGGWGGGIDMPTNASSHRYEYVDPSLQVRGRGLHSDMPQRVAVPVFDYPVGYHDVSKPTPRRNKVVLLLKDI
jgi:hypothetical protein